MRVNNNQTASRGAFTLVELVIVILIILILMAFLLPAVGRSITRGREATVIADIKNLEKAVLDFKQKFGIAPPSFFVFYETGSDFDGTSQAARNSKAIMRQLWPTYGGAVGGAFPDVDLNGDGDTGDTIVMRGADCLTFFLGGNGVVSSAGSPGALGFSSSPTSPFATGGSRIGPFYEFDASRFVDVNSNGVYEYVDPLPSQIVPYQYFSAYEGRGYRLGGYDGDVSTPGDNEVLAIGTVQFVAPYLSQDTNWPDQTGSTTTAVGLIPAGIPYNQKSFQIVSPGIDQEFGRGGLYLEDEGVCIWNQSSDAFRDREFNRDYEIDNLTNFTPGRLGDVNAYSWDR